MDDTRWHSVEEIEAAFADERVDRPNIPGHPKPRDGGKYPIGRVLVRMATAEDMKVGDLVELNWHGDACRWTHPGELVGWAGHDVKKGATVSVICGGLKPPPY